MTWSLQTAGQSVLASPCKRTGFTFSVHRDSVGFVIQDGFFVCLLVLANYKFSPSKSDCFSEADSGHQSSSFFHD